MNILIVKEELILKAQNSTDSNYQRRNITILILLQKN